MTNSCTQNFGTLYVVATPIGNLSDISARAVDCLTQVNLIACEDTRTSKKLLNHFNISTPLVCYHDHNARAQTNTLIQKLQDGQNIALISDAGTPLISDPGYHLVRACHEHGISVSPIAGACAAIAALSASGLASDKFYFYGFLPTKAAARQKTLAELATLQVSLIFYEAPHRIKSCVDDLWRIFGTRRVCFAREISKQFETICHTTLDQLPQFIQTPNQQKGEMVLVVEGCKNKIDATDDAKALLTQLLAHLPIKTAVQITKNITGSKKNTLYEMALAIEQTSNSA